MNALGIDWAGDMAAVFGDELYDASFVKTTTGAYNPDDPTGPPAVTQATYACKAIAFSYVEEFVAGELIKRGDYKVLILLDTIALVGEDSELTPVQGIIPNPGDGISVPPPNETTPKNGAIVAISSVTQASVTVVVRGEGL